VLRANVSEQFLIVNLFSDSENIGVRDKENETESWAYYFYVVLFSRVWDNSLN
jgi:hypothetical protein